MKIEIDVEKFAQQIKEGKGLSGKDGALTPLIKQLPASRIRVTFGTRPYKESKKWLHIKDHENRVW